MSADPTTEATPPGGADDSRTFTVEGVGWIARLAGVGLGGTGHVGVAPFCMIHFFREGESAPRFEALLPGGRFPQLYDSELAKLLAAARPIPPPPRE